MKTKFVIILSAQTVLMLVTLVFALLQKMKADEFRALAAEQAAIASQQRMQAESMMEQSERTRRQLQVKLDSIVSLASRMDAGKH